MTKRYEIGHPDCDLEIISPGYTEDAGLDGLDAGDYALVIGDPWGSAFAVVGSPAGLWWFARRVQDTVQGIRAVVPGALAGQAAIGVAGPGAPPARPVQAGLRFTAHFTPEAWQGGQAVEVDPQGPQDWDCTEFAMLHHGYVQDLAGRGDLAEGVTDGDDLFREDPAAPAWVGAWRGPFTITIRRARIPAAAARPPGQDQTAADLAANAAAAFDPGADPARRADGDHSLYPAVVIGGAMVFAYAEDGVLTVSVDLDDALSGESPVWAAYGPGRDRLVPVRVSVQGTEVFRAVPGEGPAPIPAGCQDHGGPPHRHDSDGEPCL